MRIQLVRNATLLITLGGQRLLVDPMFDAAGTRPSIAGSPRPRSNPLVELPLPTDELVRGVDAVLVTHLHTDHFGATAARVFSNRFRVLCQPGDADELGPVAGYLLRAGSETVCVAGDTIWCDEVDERHRPCVVVVNAAGARYVEAGSS